MTKRSLTLFVSCLFAAACGQESVSSLGGSDADTAHDDAAAGDDAREELDAGGIDASDDDAGEGSGDALATRDGGGRRDGAARDGAARDGGRRDGGGIGRDAGAGGADSGVPLIPLTDTGTATYLGFSGGLYANGANSPPAAHEQEGLLRANAIEPRDLAGTPDSMGKIVLLSIGMSNTTQEFCSQSGALPCDAWTFMGQAAAASGLNTAELAIANGAQGGRTAEFWDSPSDADYDRVRDTVLAPQGLSEAQVQIAWVKLANPRPAVSLPDPGADAFQLEVSLGNVVRALKARYPNLEQVFLSSRIYAGYATTILNPEPYAYETGFAVKWIVQAQIDQAASGMIVDLAAGDLAYGTAPWIAWGPYLWADGTTPRSDGLTWSSGQFENDGTHPGQSAEMEVGARLLSFFSTSPFTRCWFTAAASCP